MPMIHPEKLCQIEIQVSELTRSLAFYTAVFGWRPAPADLHDYIVLDVPKDCPYGISLIPSGTSQSSSKGGNKMILYFACEQVESALAQVEPHGGKIRLGPKKIPGFGTVYVIDDPDGHRFGLFQASTKKLDPSS
ncbi:MAG: VOC family protein [Oligoflexus sp.]